MSIQIRVALIALAALLLVGIVRLVFKGRLQLKYSLMWLVLSLLLIVVAVFPGIVTWLAGLLGFLAPSNLVLFAAVFCLLLVCLSLTVIVSWQSRDIRSLIQRVALIEKGELDSGRLVDDGVDGRTENVNE